jgi:hypothetical protein
MEPTNADLDRIAIEQDERQVEMLLRNVYAFLGPSPLSAKDFARPLSGAMSSRPV